MEQGGQAKQARQEPDLTVGAMTVQAKVEREMHEESPRHGTGKRRSYWVVAKVSSREMKGVMGRRGRVGVDGV